MAPDTRFEERLRQLHKHIEQWRQTRRKHGPMPGELWEEAAALARSQGVSQVSRALGLGYAALQQRVTGSMEPRSVASTASANGFVELRCTASEGGSGPSGGGWGASVEVVAGDGARLTIRLRGSSALDVAELVAAFRGGRT